MNCFMILPLLLMATTLHGHKIKKIEINDKTADVYEIKEDGGKNTVAFVNPKGDQPTLREIVYYHMIERPYGGNEGRHRYENEEGPEIDETMRPWTNSHGLPFLESFDKELETEAEDELKEEEKEAPSKEHTEVTKEEEKVIPNDEDYVEYEVVYDEAIPTDDEKSIKHIVENTILKPSQKPEPTLPVNPAIDVRVNTETTEADVTEPTTTSTQSVTVTVTDSPLPETTETAIEKKARTARKLLFDRVKERYFSKPNATQAPPTTPTSAQRRKREINMHIPEAPKLGELDYNSLSPYLRKLMMSTEKPKARIISDSESDEEERLEDIKHKMHKLFSKLKSTDVPGESGSAEVKTKTYGMNLTADRGYVWNDLVGAGIHYKVEGSESIEDNKSISEEKTVKEPEQKHYGHDHGHDQHTNVQHDSHKQENDDEHEYRKHHDIEHPDHHHDDENHENKHHGHEHENELKDDEKLDHEKEPVDEDKPKEIQGKSKKKNKKEKDETLDQLLESEDFWKWLAQWTSIYVETLAEKINETVHQEVEDQIKKKVEELKDSKAAEEVPIEPFKEDKKDDNEKFEEKKPEEKSTPEPIKEDLVKENDKPYDNNKDDHENKELPKDKEDSKTKDETPAVDNVKQSDNPTIEENIQNKEASKVIAQNVYGNTIGGEKVTNVFIFYPQKSPDKFLDDISKLNESNSNANITIHANEEGNINEVPKSSEIPIGNNKEELKDITTEKPLEKEEATQTTTLKDVEISTSEQITTTVTTEAPEKTTVAKETTTAKTEPTTESSKVEITNELDKNEEVTTEKVADDSKSDKNDDSKKEISDNEKSESEKHETDKDIITTEKSNTPAIEESSTTEENKSESSTEPPK